MINKRSLALCCLALAAVELCSFVASAGTVRGDSKTIKVLGSEAPAPPAVQNILVIPVVDSSFAYNKAARQLEAAFPGKLATLNDDYARTAAFWTQTSYGIVNLGAVVSKCFYQIPQAFPTSGNTFQQALVKGTSTYFFAIHYKKIVVDYVVDPAAGSRRVTFVSDPAAEYATSAELITQMSAQLQPSDALELRIEGTDLSGQFVIGVKQALSVPGSSVSVNFAESDAASRLTLGLTQPGVISDLTTGRTVITTDGAYFPGTMPSGLGGTFSWTLQTATAQTGSYDWSITKPDGSANPAFCDRMTTCPKWNNAAELSLLLRPFPAGTAVIRDTLVNGKPELQFDVKPFSSLQYTSLAIAGDLPKQFAGTLGLASLTSQVGKGQLNINQNSGVLVTNALQALLNTELADNSGCLTSELPNLPVNSAGLKAALDDYLTKFSAVHVVLLTDDSTILRENSYPEPVPLDTQLSDGTNTFSYQIVANVAALKVNSVAPAFAHETGHNIGFPDLYDISLDLTHTVSEFDPNLTFVGEWDMMADHVKFPQTGAFDKQSFFGWVNNGTTYNNGNVVKIMPGTDETFIVTPLEYSKAAYDNALPASAQRIVKMLILPFGDESPGSSKFVPTHYLAIENRGQNLDPDVTAFNKNLPGGGGIHVTDNLSDLTLNGVDLKPLSRRYSHSLVAGPPYPDTEGPPVAVNTSLDMTKTYPSYPGITIQAVGSVPAPNPSLPPSTMVRVAYTTTSTLDLKIEPWQAPKIYATRSIWFEPAQSATPPDNPALPTDIGNVNPPVYLDNYDPVANGGKPLNWIHVYVENKGTFNAQQVKLKVSFNSPNGIGDPALWQTLEVTEGKDIPAGGATVFSIPWSPGSDLAHQHTCIAAEVQSWKVGDFGQVADINTFNNVGQENIEAMVMQSNSPWHDVPFNVEVHNSFDRSVNVSLEPQGLSPGYSVTVDQPSALMEGKSARTFTGVLHWDPVTIPMPSTQDPAAPYWQACNVSTTAGLTAPNYCGSTWSLTAYADLGDSRVPLGGVSYQTAGRPTGTVTATAAKSPNGDIVVTGKVVPAYRGQPVRVIVRYPSGRVDIVKVVTVQGGGFTLPFTPHERGPVQISTELPRGGWPYAPTTPTTISIDSCAPSGPTPPTASCNNGVKDGTETGVDCGGLSCPPCSSGGLFGQLLIQNDWGTGYCAVVSVRNVGTKPATGWTVGLNMLQTRIYSSWNANFSGVSGLVNVTAANWNGAVPVGGTVTSAGFCADRLNGSATTAQLVSTAGTF